ncbi:MAG: N-acetylmuramoyl-L-alanine amidase CwlD [Clostridium sp.]|nr:N-acetylmuramoyl-L-alanine amidase CwlD [Clostridium sp.]
MIFHNIFLKGKEKFYKLKTIFGKRTIRLLLGIIFMFLLVIINVCIYFSQALKLPEQITVVVDAGHGGNDPGKVGVGGTLEKDINLSVALKLKTELEKRGIKVILTRESDTSLAIEGATNKKTSDMNKRMEITNSARANLLVSVHQNSFTDPKVKGAQVFYYKNSKESEDIAVTVQAELVSSLDKDNKRKAKANNDYYVLRKSTCPAIIVECGFLSNSEEEAKLISEEYQQDVAEAIAEGIYKSLKNKVP